MAASATESIADRVGRTLTAFDAINTIEAQADLEDSEFVWVPVINDQLSKFKIWAGNIEAHQTGWRSLDYRLRDSSHLQKQVMRLLDDLITSLNEAHAILSGETLPWDEDSGEADDLDEDMEDLLMYDDFEFDTELGQLANEVADTVGNLLRLSTSLRNPAPHDRFLSAEYAKTYYFEAHDKAHVEAKFPKASQTLITRLGRALSERRKYFKYRESHHERLASDLLDSGRSGIGARSKVASSVPMAMRLTGSVPVFEECDEDERSDTDFSQASFAITAPDSDPPSIPPLPKRAYNGPFQCPFCFMVISVSNTYQWKKHVLRDLRPYVCLAEDCTSAGRQYDCYREWMNHMSQKHWKSWACPYRCGFDSTTETDLRQHITSIHGHKTEMALDAMIARSGRTRTISPSSPVECPLCQDVLKSVQQYQRHVGRHQVDLAVFALPKIEDEEEGPDEANEKGKTASTRRRSFVEAISRDNSPFTIVEATETIPGIYQERHEASAYDRSEVKSKSAAKEARNETESFARLEREIRDGLESRPKPLVKATGRRRAATRARLDAALINAEAEADVKVRR
ncbi:hypothetical protein F4861DRAFT_54298 [Xylaria intraflava]|nr:hypothetical protein F4861DRAFT_54298 [Xylaria intraflava]